MSNHFLQEVDIDSSYEFGSSVDALSHLSGLPLETVALELTSILAGVGGPNASVISLAKEVHSVNLNVIVAGDKDPRQARLSELLLGPVRQLQEGLCDISDQVSEESLKRLSKSYRTKNATLHSFPHDTGVIDEEAAEDTDLHNIIELGENSVDAASKSGPWQKLEEYERWKKTGDDDSGGFFSEYKYEMRQTVVDRQRARMLRQPLILMENLSPGTIADQIKRVDRLSPLVVDGSGTIMKAAVNRTDTAASKIVTSLLSGRLLIEEGGEACCSIQMGKGSFFSVISPDEQSAIAQSKIADCVFGHSLQLTDVTTATVPSSLTVEQVDTGYKNYRETVRNVLRARRRDLLGICLILKGDAVTLFFGRMQDFTNEILEVDDESRAYSAKFVNLPASILWALHMTDKEVELSTLIATSFYLARYALHQHLAVVNSAVHAEQVRIDSNQAEVMLNKLKEIAPCSFRKLVRKFADQKKDVHQPVLDQLIETGKVVRLDTGELDISEQAIAAPI